MPTATNYHSPLIKKIYGLDPREVPLYSIPEAALYIKVAENTLRSWVRGREYEVRGRLRKFKPIIKLPKPANERLSFINLVEAFTVSSWTRIEGIPFGKVRIAIETLHKTFDSPHPLIDRNFWTDAVDLFTREHGNLINLSRWAQHEMDEVVQIILGAWCERTSTSHRLNGCGCIPHRRLGKNRINDPGDFPILLL